MVAVLQPESEGALRNFQRDEYTPWSFVIPMALAVMIGVLAADLVRLGVAALKLVKMGGTRRLMRTSGECEMPKLFVSNLF